MPSRTQLLQQLPWIGGLNTSLDPSMIPPNQLVTADQVIFDTRGSRKKRDGIAFNWGSSISGTPSVIGVHDFWFGATTKTQIKVAVMSNGTVYQYDSSGNATAITVGGKAWSGTLTSCSMATFNNKLFIAVSGAGNVMKLWDGTNAISDVVGTYQYNASISRASSGTTRTLVFTSGFYGTNGSTVIISGAGNSAYNGTFTVTGLSTTTVTNDTITYTGSSSLTEATTADTAISAGAPVLASVIREHLGRIWCNDKTSPDNINFCATGDHTLWGGWGDSGGFPVSFGDGDPIGINGIFPTFKGTLVVGKQTKLYRISGYTPEDFIVEKISDSIGVASHNSIAPIDQDDVYWVSLKGVHSLNATQAYGDLSSYYVSIDIQKSLNGFNKARAANIWACYNPTINSVAFTFSSSSATHNDSLYLYNIPIKAWYTWSGIDCQSIVVANDGDQYRFYIGSNTGRVYKSFNGTNYDISTSGVNTAILFHITTGQIFLDTNPYSWKGLKRFILFYKPSGIHNIAVNVKVDNYTINSENSLSFSETTGIDLLGSTFILGTSVLGYDVVLSPYSRQIDGYGRSVKIDITQTGINETVEIQGFAVEYEPAGTMAETFLR